MIPFDVVQRASEMVRQVAAADLALRIQAGELTQPADRRAWERLAYERAAELAREVADSYVSRT